MHRRRIVLHLFSAIALLAAACPAQTKPALSLSPDRLKRVDRLLQEYTDQNRTAGAVALILEDGKPAYERAFGWSDKEAGRKMTTDTIFRIASQTKALTSVAILSLLEEGKIGLNDPAGRYIPAFAKTTVAPQGEADAAIVPAK